MAKNDIIKAIEESDALTLLYDLNEHNDYDRDALMEIANYIEEAIGPAECWKCLKSAFTTNELIENLIYLAKENDL